MDAVSSQPGNWFRRVLVVMATLIALPAVALTMWSLLQGGGSFIRELGADGIIFVWPTMFALAVMLAVTRWRTSPHPHWQFALAIVLWLASVGAYGIQQGSPVRLQDILATCIWAGAPLVVFGFLLRLLRPVQVGVWVRLTLGSLILLALAWFTIPLALVVGCAVSGSCP